jgi:Ca-activated chloride channel family protein
MKRGVAGLALLFACGLAHGMSWADLWSRPEQQTLAQRQQAYTEAQGQQFAAAAEHLKPFSDPVSQYNRGNALAHTGDLQAAISAYDSALHSRMVDGGLQRDAQHNRDLVEQQMKSQPQSDKSGQKGEKNQQNGKGNEDGKDGNDGKEDKNSGAGKDQGKSDPGDKGQGDKKPNDAKQSDTKQSESAQDMKDQSAKDAGAQSADQPPVTESSQQQAAQREPESKDPATQGQPTPADARPRESSPPAQSEQAQSLDQWLRWIPDDPAGLLRRKFMIEHMRQQSEGQK